MPSPKPSKVTVSNTIQAIVASGMKPGGVHVYPDGSFNVEIQRDDVVAIAKPAPDAESMAEKFEDLQWN